MNPTSRARLQAAEAALAAGYAAYRNNFTQREADELARRSYPAEILRDWFRAGYNKARWDANDVGRR